MLVLHTKIAIFPINPIARVPLISFVARVYLQSILRFTGRSLCVLRIEQITFKIALCRGNTRSRKSSSFRPFELEIATLKAYLASFCLGAFLLPRNSTDFPSPPPVPAHRQSRISSPYTVGNFHLEFSLCCTVASPSPLATIGTSTLFRIRSRGPREPNTLALRQCE
ncbi:hypothetical protein GWI33_001028 [Rhynchophorus ferrugineus]|uniref:Uncharacterized protein n=1 Tax=Rhynchophorus ferrugineus TaxID=354439 RepID=A0A834MH31_RHYFE|nr:hypothetical protein GWI33_001028 [Rhynchophorus ferrugineus]